MAKPKSLTKTLNYNVLVPSDISVQIKNTVDQYRKAVLFFLNVLQENQDIISRSDWLRAIEILAHGTKANPQPLYDFDFEFPKFPSGFRRAAIAEAVGLAKSWQSNYNKYQAKKEKLFTKGKTVKKDRPPQFPSEFNGWLTHYATEYQIIDQHHVLIKLFTGISYIYRKIILEQPLVVPEDCEAGSLTLIQKKNGLELHIPVTKKVELRKVVDLIQEKSRICSVDLGINRHAVMTIQDSEGRVLATKILNGKEDNHLRKRYLAKIVHLQKQTKIHPEDEKFAVNLWNKVSNFNNNLAHEVSRTIVNFAVEHNAKILVFEHLGNLKPDAKTKTNRYNQKLMYWVKARIFKYAQYKAALEDITTTSGLTILNR
jgi:hypothetical protein